MALREEEEIDSYEGKLLIGDWILHRIINQLSCFTKNNTYDLLGSLLFYINLQGVVINLYWEYFYLYLEVVSLKKEDL